MLLYISVTGVAMKSEQAIVEQIDRYKQELAVAVAEKALSPVEDPQVDLAILTLIDKLEALFWVLDVELDEEIPLVSH